MEDSAPNVAGNTGEAGKTEAIRNDLNAGLHHLHFMSMQTKHDLVDLTSRLYALIEVLVAEGKIDLRDYDERRLRLWHQEEERLAKRAHVQVAEPVDKYTITDLPRIDCKSRLDLCKARCCKLLFPLSFQDLDEGIVKWNYAVPYQIRQKAGGYCCHNDADTCMCTVYENRPAVCRSYDCRDNKKIWIDFEKRIPAPGKD